MSEKYHTMIRIFFLLLLYVLSYCKPKEFKPDLEKINSIEINENVEMPKIDMKDFNTAMSLEFSGSYNKAIAKYETFYERYPRHRMGTYALYRVGYIEQIYKKDFKKGRRILEQVINGRPDADIRTEAYYGMALGYMKAGENEKGKNILKMLVQEYSMTTAAESAEICLQSGKCGI